MIAIDTQENYVVADVSASAILSVGPTGGATPIKQFSRDCVQPCLAWPTGIAVGPSGSVIVTDRSHVYRVPSCGDACGPTTIVKSGPPLSGPYGVAVDPKGNIIVSNGGTIFSIPLNCANACTPTIVKLSPVGYSPVVAIVPPDTPIPESPQGPLVALAVATITSFVVMSHLMTRRRLAG